MKELIMSSTTEVRSTPRTAYAKPRRPGLVTFAAVIMFVFAAFFVLIALTEFSNSYWIYNNTIADVYSIAASHLLWWGIFDSILAVAMVAAGVSILRGGIYGLMMGIFAASISGLRWFFYIPHDPWLAITIVALDALVIYGLASSTDYFAESSPY
jgi:hypothetical protein